MVSLIINPVSGGITPAVAAARAQRATAVLAARGEAGDVFVSQRRGHAGELAAAAARRGDRLVMAWGGDGTVNEVASALVGTSSMLGIVAGGSGNGLARELGLPLKPEAALHAALTAAPRAIDAGQLDGRWFFSLAGIGFDAHVAAAFDRAVGRRGPANYVRIAVRELRRYSCATYRLNDGAAVRALLVTFANSGQFGNGARIAPDARVDDGQLDLVVFQERSRLATILALPQLFTGGVASVTGVTIARVETAVVESDAPMAYHVDGEPYAGGVRLEARIYPGVLQVAAGLQTEERRDARAEAGRIPPESSGA